MGISSRQMILPVQAPAQGSSNKFINRTKTKPSNMKTLGGFILTQNIFHYGILLSITKRIDFCMRAFCISFRSDSMVVDRIRFMWGSFLLFKFKISLFTRHKVKLIFQFYFFTAFWYFKNNFSLCYFIRR